MRESCPTNTLDERAARVVAALVVLLALLSLHPSLMWLSAVLAVDFFIRAWVSRRYSPLRWIAKCVTSALGLAPKPVYAPPKRFAAQIGSVLTLAAVVLHLATHTGAAVVTLILVFAASLEAVAGFCIACWVYPHLSRTRST